ncbi:unnamed protein product [Leptidea sinapis]|uniref:Uncharacterized protein n=1 Tax=Leptidea sinapis TaxID=189913 RepID=A0A5E4QF86_9NEOP|nr:unnamed protein product [Leptidea sinapis]
MYVVRATIYQVGILTNRTNDTADSTGQQEAITWYHHNGSNINLHSIPTPILTNVTAENVVGTSPVTNNTFPWTLNNMLPPKSVRGIVPVPANITKGAVVIPSAAGVQSIALPPLLTLNNNLSHIPVPIPNVSVVSYAKINTLVRQPVNPTN